MIYIIDHQDSFTWNIVHQFSKFDEVYCSNYFEIVFQGLFKLDPNNSPLHSIAIMDRYIPISLLRLSDFCTILLLLSGKHIVKQNIINKVSDIKVKMNIIRS